MSRSPVMFILSLFTPLLAVLPPQAAELRVHDGPTYIEITSTPEDLTVGDAFMDQLPGGVEYANSARVITADGDDTLAAWYESSSGRWRGTLQHLKPGAYWIVLPQGTGEVELSLKGVKLLAGYAAATFSPTGWMIQPSSSGALSVQPSAPPQSSATYRVTDQQDSTWRASSGVYVQKEPDNPLAGWIYVDLTPAQSAGGAKSAAIQLPQGGHVALHGLPDFTRPPWADKKVE